MAQILKFPIPKNSRRSFFNEMAGIVSPLSDITQQYQQMDNYYPKVWHTCKAGGVTISAWVNPGICQFCGEEV